MANHLFTMANLDDPSRLDPLGLHLTSVAHDEILDAIVRKVVKKAGTPIALVSLIMGRIQFFRASIGLAPELEKSRATSRCLSFCQLVVKAEHEILITDASTDVRVPKELVEAYGLKAYIGVPIHHEGAIIGSLCAIDIKPRKWDSSVVREMKTIATELETRLDTLRERIDGDDAVAVTTMTLNLMLGSFLQDVKTLEEPFSRLDTLLHGTEWKNLTAGKFSNENREIATEIAQIYRNIEQAVVGMRRNALRLADGFELRKGRIDDKTLTVLRHEARAVVRAFGEMGPLVRLIEAMTTNALPENSFAKNADLLHETEVSARDALESLQRLKSTGQQILESTSSRK